MSWSAAVLEKFFVANNQNVRLMRLLAFNTLLLLLAFVPGCGDSAIERVPVSGEVVLDGHPLTCGNIRFVPDEGRPSSAAIESDGRFELASESVGHAKEMGAAPGRYRVQVASSKIIDDATIQWSAPAKYADFRTSGLEVTIDKPIKDLQIKLSSDEGLPAGGSRARLETASEAPKP